MTTFAEVLEGRLRTEPGRPLVTFYDDETGERVELSVTTYANWVAKTGSLLVEEFGLERGGTILLDLPTHWLGPVFLGAAWTVGLTVVNDGIADLYVCGPDSLQRRAEESVPVLACALRPLGVRFAEPLPAGVRDYGVEVWGQPDAFVPWEPAEPDDLAARDITQGDLLAGPGTGDRLLTTENPSARAGMASFVEPLVGGGSTIWVRHPDPDAWSRKADDERATRQVPQPSRS